MYHFLHHWIKMLEVNYYEYNILSEVAPWVEWSVQMGENYFVSLSFSRFGELCWPNGSGLISSPGVSATIQSKVLSSDLSHSGKRKRTTDSSINDCTWKLVSACGCGRTNLPRRTNHQAKCLKHSQNWTKLNSKTLQTQYVWGKV